MKKKIRKFVSFVLSLIIILSTLSIFAFSTSAASLPQTNYNNFNTPESNDFARWNGVKMVKGGSTTVDEIKWIQAALNFTIKYCGLSTSYLTVDGSFGPATKNATILFQKKYGLSADGSFGPATIAKMKAILANLNSSSTSTFDGPGMTFDPKGGTMETTKFYSSNGQITMPYAKAEGKKLIGWIPTRSTDTKIYKPGVTYNLDWTSNALFFQAVWIDFTPKNILQVNANSSSEYLSGDWYKLTNGTGNYNNIKKAGCGIVSLVSAIYNLGGTINNNEIASAIDEVFDWAYQKGYWKYEVKSGNLFNYSDEQFGNKYNFTISNAYSETSTDSILINHIKNGGTAVVHVYKHYMVIADYKIENNVEKFFIYDPAPGSGTGYNSTNRSGITQPQGSWISINDLKNDGGTKGKTATITQRMENIEIDTYWLVSRK